MEKAEKLLLEKEEIERVLLSEIHSKDEEMSKLLEVLTSVHRKDRVHAEDENMSKLLEVLTSVQGKERESVKRRIEMKAENKSLNRKIQSLKSCIRSVKFFHFDDQRIFFLFV